MEPVTASDESAHGPARLADGLASRLVGELLRRGDPGYDDSRLVWNGTIDRSAVIARCAEVEDVITCVQFAAEQDLLVAVRGDVRMGAEVVGGGGDGWLDHLILRGRDAEPERVDAAGLFVMIGPGRTPPGCRRRSRATRAAIS